MVEKNNSGVVLEMEYNRDRNYKYGRKEEVNI